ncbi:hypothetical protein [Actinoplanes sp. CA-252034]|uniref:hypothetical protein n=1 Tax=Actinoplanes sp. CA-252034 TaxID=3239906 RepID=UPI003D95AC8F
MALITHRRFTYPAVLALCAGLGVTTVAGVPSPASAGAPVIAGVPEPPDRQRRLEKALLTERDVPAGYVKQDLGGTETILAEVLSSQEPGASPCDMADELSALSVTDTDTSTTNALSVSGPTIPAAEEPATSAPAPADPVKGSPPVADPVKAGPPSAPVAEPDVPVTAGVVFLNEQTNAVAIEALAVIGEDAALTTIDQIQEVLDECPLIEVETVKVTTAPLAWNPPLGDESITGTVLVEAKYFGIEFSAKIKFAQVAYRDVALTVALVGADDPRDHDFKKLARTAVRKLVTTSGITTGS